MLSPCVNVSFMTLWLRPLGSSWSGTVSSAIVDSGVLGVGGWGEGGSRRQISPWVSLGRCGRFLPGSVTYLCPSLPVEHRPSTNPCHRTQFWTALGIPVR